MIPCKYIHKKNTCIYISNYNANPIRCLLENIHIHISVSYTHLDVYKRQVRRRPPLPYIYCQHALSLFKWKYFNLKKVRECWQFWQSIIKMKSSEHVESWFYNGQWLRNKKFRNLFCTKRNISINTFLWLW